MSHRVESGPGWTLHLGRWQDVLSDVVCDSLITDPPYGARTHDKQQFGRRMNKSQDDPSAKWCTTKGIEYAAISDGDVAEIANHWSGRCAGWICAMTSHDLVSAYTSSMEKAGRYVFAPLPCVMRAMNVRLQGDGPSNWTVWMVVARPRTAEAAKWGTLPGAYVTPSNRAVEFAGQKPMVLMRAVIRDYSRPGDLICDPYAGSGTTLLAGVAEGRRAIGAEMDSGRFDIAVKRLRAGYTPDMFSAAG